MTNDLPNLQTFEIFMPERLMRTYKTELYAKYVMECEAIAKGQGVQKSASQATAGLLGTGCPKKVLSYAMTSILGTGW